MKKAFLIIALMGSLYADAQTYIADKFIMRKGFVLKSDTVTGIQKDTNFVSDKSVPTALAVANFVAGHAGGSSTPFLFGINDTAMVQDRYMNMGMGNNFYYDFDGDQNYNNYLIFDSRSYDLYYQQLPKVQGSTHGEVGVSHQLAGLFSSIYDGSHNISTNIYVHDSVAAINTNNGDYSNYKNSELKFTPTSVTIAHVNDNIAKNIITSVNSQLADVNGNIDIAAGGAPMRFGIEDTTMVQNRYMDLVGGKQFYYDYDGDQAYNNYLLLGSGSFDSYTSNLNSGSEIYNYPGKAGLTSNTNNILSYITADNGTLKFNTIDNSNGVINGITSYLADKNGVRINASYSNGNSSLILGNGVSTVTRSNDNIAKNIITSINNQLADINGNINTPNFTIAQRNAMPVPSAGFTAFITDGVANDTSVGVNQSWNGMVWKNNW